MKPSAQAVMDLVFGEDFEWWHEDSRERIYAAADRLITNGLSIAAAAEIVGTIHAGTANEYGG